MDQILKFQDFVFKIVNKNRLLDRKVIKSYWYKTWHAC